MGGMTLPDNVALLPLSSSKFDAQLSYSLWGPSSGNASGDINAAVAAKLGKRFALKAFFSYDGAQNSYTRVDEEGSASRTTFTPNDMLVGGGISFALSPDRFSLGVDVKYLKSNLSSSVSYSAAVFDIVAAAKFGGIKAAFGINSLGGKVKAAKGNAEYSLPTSLVLGGDYLHSFGKSSVCADLEMNYFFKGGFRAGLGAEYAYNDFVFARAGYNYGADTVLPSFFSVGAGLKIKVVTLDVTYLLGSDAARNTLSVGLGCRF